MFKKCKRILLKPWKKWRTKRVLSQAKEVIVMPEHFEKMFESIPTVKVIDGMVKGDVEMLEKFKKELEWKQQN